MLKVLQYGRSVFVKDPDMGDPRFGTTLYGNKFRSVREATKFANGICREIAAGLPRDKLSIASDIEKRLEANRFLPPAWR